MKKTDYEQAIQDELKEYESNVHMTPDEKQALRKWVASGHTIQDQPVSKYVCGSCMPTEYNFLDVYRLDKELDAGTKGMTPEARDAYLKDYFGYTEPDETEIQWEEARKNTPPIVKTGYIKLQRETFWLWEFISSKGLWEEAAEYLQAHRDEETPFEWEGSLAPNLDSN